MNYRLFFFLFLILNLLGCEQSNTIKSKKIEFDLENRYKNTGFALIFNSSLDNIKELEPRSLDIFHKSLKKNLLLKLQTLKIKNI